jgi:hypothetical protein
LRGEVFNTEAEAIAIGQGCSAITMPLSDGRLSTFAAPMAEHVLKLQREGLPGTGRLMIGRLDADGLNQKWTRTEVAPRIVVGDGTASVVRLGGLPTTTTLRHRDDTYDDETRAGFHTFIAAKLGKPAPTAAEEAADPAAADSYYARGATWLRENTRDAKKFDILLNENITYGFRRNLFGLKLPGFVLNAAIVAFCLAILWRRWPVDLSNTFDAKLLAVVVIAVLHAIYLAIFVTEAGVFEGARTYARQLLLCTQSPHFSGAPKPRSTAFAPPARRGGAKATIQEK